MMQKHMPTFSAAVFDKTLKEEKKCESQQPKAKTFTCLYATPTEIPLPTSPCSSPPSPYIVNHKARRPALLLTNSSELDVPSSHPETLSHDVEATTTTSSTSLSFPIREDTSEDDTNGVPVWDSTPPQGSFWDDKSAIHISNGGIGHTYDANCLAWESNLLESVRTKANKDHEPEYLYNRGQSVSNSDVEADPGAENSHNLFSSGVEFYDARDELSSASGTTPSSVNNIEAELRLSLLMESEKRRQAEESLETMQVHWRRLREQLAHVGVFVPLDPTSTEYSMNIADELRCQLEFTRFVSDSLDIELAKAEVEMEMASEIEAKKFEITHLSNRLHYYEIVNQEMSQRNQEAIEGGRREGEKRKRRQRWRWGAIAVTMTLGGAVLAWPYSLTNVSQPQPSPINEAS